MLRIYSDQNIISKLCNEESELLRDLQELVTKDVLVFYSQGHLNDLSSDVTDKKFNELEVIKSLANGNFLYIDYDDNNIQNDLIGPNEAFEKYGTIHRNIGEFIKNVFDESGDPLVDLYIRLKKLQPVDLGSDIEAALKKPENDPARQMYEKLGITKRYYTMGEWIPIVGDLFNKFENDPKLLREIRRLSQIHLGVDKFKIKIGSVDFDEKLSKSKLGKSFREMLDQQLLFLPEEQRTYYNEFITGFNMINFLGIDYEKNKKVKFTNTNNDALHAFFASATDMLISDDKGILNKARFLYNIYGIETRLSSFEEFKNFVKQYRSHEYLDEMLFISQLEFYGGTNIIVEDPLLVTYNSNKTEVRKLGNKYWKLFDRLTRVEVLSNSQEYYILHPSSSRRNNIIFFKEINYIIQSLNNMLRDNVSEINQTDKENIKQGNWEGKLWSSSYTDYLVVPEKHTCRLLLAYPATQVIQGWSLDLCLVL